MEDRETAVNSHDLILAKFSRERPLILYTDGSGIKGRVGAAATVGFEDQYAYSQMGDDDSSTVYAAKLRTIEMAFT